MNTACAVDPAVGASYCAATVTLAVNGSWFCGFTPVTGTTKVVVDAMMPEQALNAKKKKGKAAARKEKNKGAKCEKKPFCAFLAVGRGAWFRYNQALDHPQSCCNAASQS